MYRSITTNAIAALALTATANAQTTLVDADFEGPDFIPGEAPPAGAATDRPRGWQGSISMPSLEDSIFPEVIDSSTFVGPTVSDSQFLRLSEGTNGQVTAGFISFDSDVTFSTGTVTATFDILFESFSTYRVTLREGTGDGGGGNAGSFNIFFDDDGSISTSAGGPFIDASYETDTAYTFSIIADLDSGLVDIALNGTIIADDYAYSDGDESIGRINFGYNFRGSSAPLDRSFQIDNVSLTHIPAPASLALVALAGITASRRR